MADRAGKHCADCGWVFEAGKELERCPRCGLPTAVSFEVEGNLTTVLDQDTRCRACGYNLRGLARSGLCPECAAPIAISAREDFLCFAEPRYVGRLARGDRWIIRGLTLNILAVLLLIGAQILAMIAPASSSLDDWLFKAWSTVCIIGVLAGLLLFLAGVWLMTSAEPGATAGWRRDRARKLVRAGLVVGVVAIGLDAGLEALVPPLPVMATFTLLSIGFSVLGVIGLAAYFYYLRDIALRLPDARFAARAGALAWNLAVAVGTLVFFSAVERLLAWAPVISSPATASAPAPSTGAPAPIMTTWGLVSGCVGSVASLVTLVLFLRAIRLHSHLRKPLDQQAKLAQEHWRAFGVSV
jgi:predicted Zn-ribbon and HTH transcriptional regulator